MTVAGHRHERIAGEIKQEIGVMLAGELKDPRLAGLATVTEVRVTPDLKQARVYVSVMGTEAEQASTLKGLSAAAGFVRHELSERLAFAARSRSAFCAGSLRGVRRTHRRADPPHARTPVDARSPWGVCWKQPSSTMTRKPAPAAFDGALVVNKPSGRTSHDVVDAVRRLLGFRQVGHLGTLDPLATGVLVLLLGRATRFAQFYSGRRKRYHSTFRFGFATDTYDSDGTALGPDTSPVLNRQQIEGLAQSLVGRFPQMPPAFSAKKIHGRPAHELARKQKPVELKPVEVEVFEFRLLELDGSLARFAIECARGDICALAGPRHGRAAWLWRARSRNYAHRSRRIHARPGHWTG